MTTTLEIVDHAELVQRALQQDNDEFVTYREAETFLDVHGLHGKRLMWALNYAYKQGMQDASSVLGLEMDCGV